MLLIKKNKKVIAILSIITMSIGLIGGYYLFSGKAKFIKYDYVTASLAKNRVDNAQYLPDAELLATKSNDLMLSNDDIVLESANSNDLDIDLEGFNNIIESIGTIDGEGAGKYLGYNIYEIKAEIYYVLDTVPAFNQWFRLPIMREEEGYSKVPYYEQWAYKLEYDQETEYLSITRVCYSTRFHYLDFESKKTIEYYSDNESAIQYQIMRTNYYYDAEGREVVECYVYSVAVDHVIRNERRYNKNTQDYYPLSFQYLKNVRDTSLTKYHITVAERYRDDNSFDEGGWDIRGDFPYGSTRNFLHLDYTDENNIQMLKYSQVFNTSLYRMPTTSAIIYYNKTGDIRQLYLSAYDYLDSYNPEQAIDFFSRINIENLPTMANYFTHNTSLNNYSRRHGINKSGNKVTRSTNKLTGTNDDSVKYYLTHTIMSLANSIGVPENTISDYYNESTGYLSMNNAGYEYEQLFDGLITSICKVAIDNSYLKNNWPDIYKLSSKAIKLTGKENVSSTSQIVKLNNGESNITIDNNNIVTYTLSATVISSLILENKSNYSLSLVLRANNGTVIILASNYNEQYNKGKELSLSNSGTYNLSDINAISAGTYTLGYALTKQVNDKDVICSDILTAYVSDYYYYNCSIDNKIRNGFEYTFKCNFFNDVLKITVTKNDIENPVITSSYPNDIVIAKEDAKICEIFEFIDITDNDRIKTIKAFYGATQYTDWSATVIEGKNYIIVTDRTGNSTTYEFEIVIT